jgi:hypothetical protein
MDKRARNPVNWVPVEKGKERRYPMTSSVTPQEPEELRDEELEALEVEMLPDRHELALIVFHPHANFNKAVNTTVNGPLL